MILASANHPGFVTIRGLLHIRDSNSLPERDLTRPVVPFQLLNPANWMPDSLISREHLIVLI